jgi:hypothetical protein
MKRYLKTYEMAGFNEVQTNTVYCGVKVSMSFKDGNVVMGKSARLQTSNPFAQDAIEHDPRFGWGNIKLVNVVELEDEEVPADKPQETTTAKTAGKKGKKASAEQQTTASDVEVVESVKTLNDLDAWFAEKGVTLEGSSKSYIAGLCEKYGVVFPNLKY